MRGSIGYAEAPQYQVVVRAVLHFLDRYILEQMHVYAQDEVGPGAHLPPAPVHGPCTDIVRWEEVDAHVLQTILHRASAIPLSCSCSSVAARSVSKSPTTSSGALWGRLQMGVTTFYMVEASSGSK